MVETLAMNYPMNTYYARHNAGLFIDKATKQKLCDENLIAVHYATNRDNKLDATDNRSVDPQDYSGRAKSIIGALSLLSRNGGYVCVEYQDQNCTKVGVVPADSEIKLLESTYENDTRVAVLKTVAMSKVRKLTAWTAVRLLAGRPQHHALCRWYVGDRVKHLVDGTEAIRNVTDLIPAEQEILCSEFMRLKASSDLGTPRMAVLLTAVGRTMKDVDILGLEASGKTIAAQVTHVKPEAGRAKLEVLRAYADASQCTAVYFCMAEKPYLDGAVHIVPLQTVYLQFIASEIGIVWLKSLSLPS